MTPRKNPFRKDYTPAQLRRFRLLTLAQMVYFESIGLPLTTTTAKRQAMEALDISGDGEAITADQLVCGLFDAADEAKGITASKAADMERTL